MKNQQDSFEYMAELSKCEFLGTINGLLELQGQYADKIKNARNHQRTGVFLSMEESELLSGFILKMAGELMGHYHTLHGCTLQLQKRQRIVDALLLSRTPNLLEFLINAKTPQV